MDEKTLKEIKEINEGMVASLGMLGETMLRADADQWAYYLEYEDYHLWCAVEILMHVLSNIGIKNGHITAENVEGYGKKLAEFVFDFCGVDTKELVDKLFKKDEE